METSLIRWAEEFYFASSDISWYPIIFWPFEFLLPVFKERIHCFVFVPLFCSVSTGRLGNNIFLCQISQSVKFSELFSWTHATFRKELPSIQSPLSSVQVAPVLWDVRCFLEPSIKNWYANWISLVRHFFIAF